MDEYEPKCRKHNIPMVEIKTPIYRMINILQGCPKYRVFRCPKRFCKNEVHLQVN